jgi:hypothetical protein
MTARIVRVTMLVLMVMGLAVGAAATAPVRAQDEPDPGSMEITLGERANVVARTMVQIPITLTCTMPSVPWETGPFGTNASVTVYVSQAAGRSIVKGEASLYNLEPQCDGTPRSLVVEVIGDGPFKGGPAVVSAHGGVFFVAWEPQYVELSAGDSTGNQVVRFGG